MAIAASWEKQGGSAALAEADKEYAEAGVVPKAVGGGVAPPVILTQVEPEMTPEAKAAKFGGIVTVNLWVNEQGDPTHVRVVRGIGKGLDEKAVEAVKQWKFRPAMEDGKPVTVELNVEIMFRAGGRRSARGHAVTRRGTGWLWFRGSTGGDCEQG